MKSMYNILFTLLIFYISLVLVMYVFQRRIMYLPDRNMEKPEFFALKYQEIDLITSDNIKIKAWYKPAPAGKETLLYFHGNAGNIADRYLKLKAFSEKDFGIFAISYRGYGNSEGSPLEIGLYHDARAAIKYLNDNGVPPSNIVIYGESLGTGVSVQMATEYKAKALVLEAPYISVKQRAIELYPIIPVKYLLKDSFDSLSKIKSVNIPILMLHGDLDRTIPLSHGQLLFENAHQPKKFIIYPGIGHTDFVIETLASDLRNFVDNNL